MASDVEAVSQHLRYAASRRAVAARERAFLADDVRAGLDKASALCDAGDRPAPELRRRVARERLRCDAQDRATLERAQTEILAALARLDGVAESAELSRRAPAELRRAGGFTRVMISRTRGTRWYPDTMSVSDGADPEAAEFARFAREENQIPLGSGLAETRMLRRREPVLVRDAATDPRTYKPLVRVTRTPGYVAAPIVAADHVIGFLHADRADQRSPVAPGDLEAVSLFACEFGVIFESAVLRERLDHARAEVRQLMGGLSARLDALGRRDLLLGVVPDVPRPEAGGGDPAPQRDALLSAREREIVELIARGATNRAVAQELTISTETVKTHVSSILRKLRVSSRAGAVARYLQLRGAVL